MIEKNFVRELNSLDNIFDFLDEFGRINHLPESNIFALKLCIEELFVNMVKYQPKSKHPVLLKLQCEPGKMSITMVDQDVEPFDVSQPRDVDTSIPIEQRRPGGLGIFLVHQLMDKVLYDYQNRVSTISLIKNL